MSVTERFEVIMDIPDKRYLTNEEVSGRVVLKAKPSEVESKGLTIKFIGQATITGRSGGKKGRRLQTYFDTPVQYLVGDGTTTVEVVKAGQQISYCFKFQLPCDSTILPLPSSYAGAWGNVEYYLVAELDLSPYKHNEYATKVIQVIAPLDLNYLPEVIPAVITEASETYCCSCCGGGQLTLNVKLPKGGYAPQEKIPFQVTVNNKTGSKIKQLTAGIGEKVQYRLYSMVRTRYENKFKELSSDFVINPASTGEWNGELEVPDVSPTTTLEYPSIIIGVEYFVVVRARVSGGKRLPVFCPIVIGTVPIPMNPTDFHRLSQCEGGDLSRPESRISNAE